MSGLLTDEVMAAVGRQSEPLRELVTRPSRSDWKRGTDNPYALCFFYSL